MNLTPPPFRPESSLNDFIIEGYLTVAKGLLTKLHSTASAVAYQRAADFLALVDARVMDLSTEAECTQLAYEMVAALFHDDGLLKLAAPPDDNIRPLRSPADCFHLAAMAVLRRGNDLEEIYTLESLGYQPALFSRR